MFSYSVLSPGNFLSIKKFTRLQVLYRLVVFCLVALFLSILMTARSLALESRSIAVTTGVRSLTGMNHLLVKCDSTTFTVVYNQRVKRQCKRVFIVPVVNGKQLTKYARSYTPATYCVGSYLTATYFVNMTPTPYTIHLGCNLP